MSMTPKLDAGALDTDRAGGSYVSEPVVTMLEIPAFSGEVPSHLLSVFFNVVSKVKNKQLLQARTEIDSLIYANPILAKQSSYWCFRIDMELYSGCIAAAHGVLAEAFLQNPEPREVLVEKARSMRVEDISRSGVFSDTTKNNADSTTGFSRSPIYEKLQFLASNTSSQDFVNDIERSELSLHESQTALYTSITGNPIPQPLCNIQRDSPGRAQPPAQDSCKSPDNEVSYLDDDTLRLSALR